jgi:hypothetical protein
MTAMAARVERGSRRVAVFASSWLVLQPDYWRESLRYTSLPFSLAVGLAVATAMPVATMPVAMMAMMPVAATHMTAMPPLP